MHTDTFDSGLVMAGAISAGAHSAGAMGFLIERNGRVFLAIIPLLGTANVEINQLPWPSYTGEQLDALHGQMESQFELSA